MQWQLHTIDSDRMKVLTVAGARPQFIKAAAVSRVLRQAHTEVLVHTGQHYDREMSELFFEEFGMPRPDHSLGIGSGSHGWQTGHMLIRLEEVLLAEQPDWVLVYGDTNSTLAGALAAAKLGMRVAHVEAGLRSFNRTMPEEINRIVADHICDVLLAPTLKAVANASAEGLTDKCHLVGDIMVDSLAFGIRKARSQSPIVNELSLQGEDYAVLTLHRPYNVDDPQNLFHILTGLDALGRKIVFPVHPRTRNVIAKMPQSSFANIICIEPLAYLDFLMLMDNSAMILSDSGGIQKEAYILQKPCVTLRSETEWVETVESGWNLLLDPSSPSFPGAIASFKVPENHPDIFGKDVAQVILQVIEQA